MRRSCTLIVSMAVLLVALGLAACDGDSGSSGNGVAPDTGGGGGSETTGGGGGTDTTGGGGTETSGGGGDDTAGGGDDTAGGGDDTAEPPVGPATQTITAAEGGTLATSDGAAAIEVPAGALDADTELTVAVLDKTGDAQTPIYDFGPDGLTFSTPATLSIAYDGNPGEGKKAVLAWQDGDTWTEIAGSGVVGDRVAGQVAHFTAFTVIIIDGQVQSSDDCDALRANFQACGGDVDGAWEVVHMCYKVSPDSLPNPFEETCPDGTTSIGVLWDGVWTFDATEVSIAVTSQVMTTVHDVSLSCILIGVSCETLPQELDPDENETVECVEDGDRCVCTVTKVVDDHGFQFSSPYRLEGNEIVTTDPDGAESRSLYCVQGDELNAYNVDAEMNSPDLFRMQRQ